MEAQGCTPVTLDALQTPAVRLMGSPDELAADGIGAVMLLLVVVAGQSGPAPG